MPSISFHRGWDWCHICGERMHHNADVFYAKNAEHDPEGRANYVRICALCAIRIYMAAAQPVELPKESIVIQTADAIEVVDHDTGKTAISFPRPNPSAIEYEVDSLGIAHPTGGHDGQ